MTEIRKPAIKIMQGKRSLFLTYFEVSDFSSDFYRVDRLDVQGAKGMQRLLNTTRAKSFGNDILGADRADEAFLPTSIFLATEGSINYDAGKQELFFDSNPSAGVCPLDVVDGQHRIEGLRAAAEKSNHLQKFRIATIIADKMSKAEQMLQFVTVNTKQQPVDKGVAQHITARFTAMLELEELPYLPSWIQKQAEKGDDSKALKIAKYFNEDKASPWYQRIQFADEQKTKRHTIKQATFITSIKRTLLAKNHPLHQIPDEEKQFGILHNYWDAVAQIFLTTDDVTDDAETQPTVLKYTGLEFFHFISGPIINQLAKNRIYTVHAIKQCMQSAQEHLSADEILMMTPDFWKTGQGAGELNSAGRSKMTAAFARALAEAHSDDIQL